MSGLHPIHTGLHHFVLLTSQPTGLPLHMSTVLHTHARARACKHLGMCIRTRARACMHMHICTCTYAHAHAHTKVAEKLKASGYETAMTGECLAQFMFHVRCSAVRCAWTGAFLHHQASGTWDSPSTRTCRLRSGRDVYTGPAPAGFPGSRICFLR